MTGGPALLPDPGTPMFETFVKVRFHEVDPLGHVNNSAYLNYLEQAAIDHATIVGLDMARLRAFGGVFVARRHDIVFVKPAFSGELLRIVTWLDDPRGARVDRHYLVLRGPEPTAGESVLGRIAIDAPGIATSNLIVRATTEWVFASERGRPRRVPEAVVSLFRAGAERRLNEDRHVSSPSDEPQVHG